MRAARAPSKGRAILHGLLRVSLPLGLALVAVALQQATRQLEAYASSPLPVVPALPFSPVLVTSSLAGELPGGGVPTPLPLRLSVEPGETLSELLEGLGLSAPEALGAAEEMSRYVDPRKLRAGGTYAAYYDADAALAAVEVDLEGRGRVRLARREDGWEPSFDPVERTVRTRVVTAALTTSLEEAIRDQGASPALAYEMADALQWDLDFTRDLRVGDRFDVLFEEIFYDGALGSVGDVLAVRYENRGQTYEAFRYGGQEGFYDASGRPMQKMFLRSPLRYSRITSRFSRRRFHPILKVYRPHWGVDYGAPIGTPVRVTANGTVTFAGWDRGGGRVVKVRHPGGYVTEYLHLSRFGQGVRPGRPVRQGEVIAFTGSTGLATAPHLDYRVKHNGRWIDPLSLKSVPARPLAASEMASFEAWRDTLLACLDSGSPLPAEAPLAPQQVAAAPAADSPPSTAAAGRR